MKIYKIAVLAILGTLALNMQGFATVPSSVQSKISSCETQCFSKSDICEANCHGNITCISNCDTNYFNCITQCGI